MNRLARQPDVLTVGPLRLSLFPSPRGPRLKSDDDAYKSFIWLVDCAVESAVESAEEGADKKEGCENNSINNNDAYHAICDGNDWYHEIMILRAPDPEYDDVKTLRARWQDLVADVPDDKGLRVLQVGPYDPVLVPHAVLSEFTQELKRLRQQFILSPPWLFCVDACAEAHHSEYDLIMAAEAAYAAGEQINLQELGLDDCENCTAQRLEHLLRWDAQNLARYYIGVLDAADALGFSAQASWLFAEETCLQLPHPDEQAIIQGLEIEAAAIDAHEQASDGQEDSPALIARRQALLQHMHTHGLLNRRYLHDKEHYLHAWSCPVLLDFYKAACEASSYLESYARRQRLGDSGTDAAEQTLLHAPICIDLFRGLPVPDGVERWDWIAWGEYLLREHGPGPDVQADQGIFPYHDNDGLINVLWRRDATVPALRYLRLERPS